MDGTISKEKCKYDVGCRSRIDGTHFAQLQFLSLSLSLIQCSPQEAMTVWTIHNGETVSGKSKNYIELMKKVGLPG